MAQMWQYYDRAICDAIKESVEPIMDQYKPPGIVKKIYFKRMTFGDLPITIDDVWVENEGEKHILLEVPGSPATPVLASQTSSCTDFTVHLCYHIHRRR